MDLQLVVALNAMVLSGLAVVVSLLYQPIGKWPWMAVNVGVVLVGGLALYLAPEKAGTLVALFFVPFVLAPALLTSFSVRRSQMGYPEAAARYARWAARCHPVAANRFSARLLTALTLDGAAGESALAALADSVSPEHRPLVDVCRAAAQDDWGRVLVYSRQSDAANELLKPYEIRALGEIGRLNEMVAVFAHARAILSGHNLVISKLFVLVFSGRNAAVDRLFEGPLSGMVDEAKFYWRAVATLCSGGDVELGRRTLATLADTAAQPKMRTAARRHLAIAAPGDSLVPSTLAVVNALEDQTLPSSSHSEGWRASPVTLGLLALCIAGFVAEVTLGGSENWDTLIKLGALWPPVVYELGEWWRLVTAGFLHYGPAHLATNMFVLFILGKAIEAKLGSLNMLGVYLIGLIGSSAFVLWLMSSNTANYGVLVGASGAIFALFGAEVALVLERWVRARHLVDNRQIVLLGVMLAMQMAIDLSVPNISFAAHASGFLIGLMVTAIWLFLFARPDRRAYPG